MGRGSRSEPEPAAVVFDDAWRMRHEGGCAVARSDDCFRLRCDEAGVVGFVGTGLAMGGPVGMPALIEIVQQDERRKKLGLDALVAYYLIPRGPDGLDLVEDRFLKNPHAEYTHVYSTIMALRFHG